MSTFIPAGSFIQKFNQDPTKLIDGFFEEYRWLSNFHPCPVIFEGTLYPSSENAYQAAKTLDPIRRLPFQSYSAQQAKKYGGLLELRPDWEEVKLDVMRTVLQAKFSNVDLREKLLATGSAKLVEGNWWRGIGGKTNSGVLTMEKV